MSHPQAYNQPIPLPPPPLARQQGERQFPPTSTPYNPYTHPQADPSATSNNPYLRSPAGQPPGQQGQGGQGMQGGGPQRQGSLGGVSDSDYPQHTQAPYPHPDPSSSRPPVFSGNMSNMYPAPGMPNIPYPHPNPYQYREPHAAQLPDRSYGQPNMDRHAWGTSYMSHREDTKRRGSMPEHGAFGYDGLQMSGNMSGPPQQPRNLPRIAYPGDNAHNPAQYPYTGRDGPNNGGPSRYGNNQYSDLPTAYDAYGRPIQPTDNQMQPFWPVPNEPSSSKARIQSIPTVREESAVPDVQSGANSEIPEQSSETMGSRPSTGGVAGSRPSTGVVGAKKEGGRRRESAVKQTKAPQPLGIKAEPILQDEHNDEGDEDGDGEADGEEKMDHRKRKRNRTIRSCVPCHNHKRKCDRQRPCSRCTALGLTGSCVYEVDETRDQHDPAVAEEDRLRRRVAELEQVVRELRQRQPPRAPAASAGAASTSRNGTPLLGLSDGEADKAGIDSKKRREIVDRYARFKIDEAAMAQVAAAAAITNHPSSGKGDVQVIPATGTRQKRSASDGDRMGKEYMAEPYQTHLLPGEEIVYDRSGRKVFLGAPAGKSMLRRLRELMSSHKPDGTLGEAHPPLTGENDESLLDVPEDLAFTGWFPDMRKTFPFTTIWSHENFSGEIIGLLPNKEQAELLLDSWRDEVCAFFLAWHTPTLEAEYRRFFSMTTLEKMNVPLSSLSVYLMICSLGCVMRASKSEIFGHPSREVAQEAIKRGMMPVRDPKDLTANRLQSELYLSAAYQALRLCSFMSNPTLYTIQAQILINVYLLNSERASDAWTQTGSLVRQCIAMGLHKDPLSLDARISMRDAEVRRRVWWSVAGLDALFCVSFGRPSSITFYTTNLPQDRTDDNLSDLPGSAQTLLPPSNVLRNETTDMSYHAAYFQLTIPSLELLDRIFRIDWEYSRSAIYGWFSRNPEATTASEKDEQNMNTYEEAIRLANDMFQWYAHIPRGMRFEPEEDTAESFSRRAPLRINQTLALCVKTFMIVMILHRPYLRADPAAYPESSEICFKAARLILSAYSVGSKTKASIFWSWWTMSFRAFHAGTVCAFLAIRQPDTELATKCLGILQGAIAIFEDRIASWNQAHPVQADLCNGLLRLQKLATAATKQHRNSPNPSHPASSSTHSGSARSNATHLSPIAEVRGNGHPASSEGRATTPLSQIKGFPVMGPIATSPAMMGGNGYSSGTSTSDNAGRISVDSTPYIGKQGDPFGLVGDGFNGPESLAFPQMWASMFGIKVDGEEGFEADPFNKGNYNASAIGLEGTGPLLAQSGVGTVPQP